MSIRNAVWFVVGLVVAVAVAEAAGADPPQNAVLARLLEQGITVGSDVKIPITPPVMLDGLDAAGQKKALELIATAQHTVERLSRDSAVSPFVFNLPKGKPVGDGMTARTVDLYFIAYGDLDVIYTPEFRDELAKLATEAENSEVPTRSAVLNDEQIAARKLVEPADRAKSEMWLYGKFPMLDRVYISATRHAISHRTDESIVLASQLDERFTGDAEFPNQWQSIERDAAGKIVLGEVTPYSGAGFYVKVTKLHEPAGAVFIEYHHAFVEPRGWFNGTSLLSSKLPLVAQDRVRKFRRQLASASERAGK